MSHIDPQHEKDNELPDDIEIVEEPPEEEEEPYTDEEVAQTLQVDSAIETAQFEGSAERIMNAIIGSKLGI